METIYIKHAVSTNLLVKNRLESGNDQEVILVAEEQSAGTGQHQRFFASPAGGLYFSMLLHPEMEIQSIPLMTLAVGVSCAEYFSHKLGLSPQLKWPNDILIKGKKLGGILCESIIQKNRKISVIIGVGLNINSRMSNFPAELQEIITTVYEESRQCCELSDVLSDIVALIKRNCLLLADNRKLLLEKWQDHDYLYEKQVQFTCDNQQKSGYGAGITENGGYTFLDRDGVAHTVIAGQLRAV